MKNIKTTSHTRYDHKFHVVFCTRYGKQALRGDIGLRLRDIIRQVCERNNVVILRGNIRLDHVHLLLSMPPHVLESKLIKYIKGVSSRKLQMGHWY